MPSSGLSKKCATALAVLKRGGVRALVRELARKFVTVTPYRLDLLRLDRMPATEPLVYDAERYEIRFATHDDLRGLFASWRDPAEPLVSHRRVFEAWGFDRCVLVIDRKHGRVAHFHFLVTAEDAAKAKKWLPWNVYRRFWGPDAGWQEWVYTFLDSRKQGLSVAAFDYLLAYCRQAGIVRIYSRRGAGNTPSVKMADRSGYLKIGALYEVALFGRPELSRTFVALDRDAQLR